MKKWAAVISVAILLAGAALAQEGDKPAAKKDEGSKKSPPKNLLVGDKVPALAIDKWIKGAPVAKFDAGKVYVVEFWATWCGPCIQVQPHLSELQKKFKDKGVTCISVTSVDERGNTLDAVETMVKKRDDKMGYTVAWDKDRTTNEAYMDAARQDSIPCAFLIDQEGTLAWIGHPRELDEPLEKVVDKKWDLKKAAAEFKEEFDANKAMEEVTAEFEQFQAAMQKEDFAAALKIIDEVSEKKPVLASRLATGRVFVLLESKQYDKAYAAAEQAADKYFSKKAPELAHLAQTILHVEGVEKINADLAVKLALRAAAIAPEDGFVLDTLAMAYAEKGDFAKAAETVKKEIAHAEKHEASEDVLADLKNRLSEYEAKAKGEPKPAEKK